MPKHSAAKENQQGRWSNEEHYKMLALIAKFGSNWKKIAEGIGTRKCAQVRSHYQKYIDVKQKKEKLKNQKQFANVGVQAVDFEIDFELDSLQQDKQTFYKIKNLKNLRNNYFLKDINQDEREHGVNYSYSSDHFQYESPKKLIFLKKQNQINYFEKEIKQYNQSLAQREDQNLDFIAFDL